MYKIYKHTCKVNGKSYIGQTSSTDIKNDRWQNGAGYKQCTVFYRAIKKYGWDNFTHEIIEDNIETLEQANEREHYWIMHYHTWIDDPNCWGYTGYTASWQPGWVYGNYLQMKGNDLCWRSAGYNSCCFSVSKFPYILSNILISIFSSIFHLVKM